MNTLIRKTQTKFENISSRINILYIEYSSIVPRYVLSKKSLSFFCAVLETDLSRGGQTTVRGPHAAL